jgi:hypothetical protein
MFCGSLCGYAAQTPTKQTPLIHQEKCKMKNRSKILPALVLILIGLWLLAIQVYPPLRSFANGVETWPFSVIGVGVLLAILALITWSPGLLIPACIVGGIGTILYYQNTTGRWESWAYAWALIPGFVGTGLVLSGLLQRSRSSISGGVWTIFYSIFMFLLFGSFLGELGSGFAVLAHFIDCRWHYPARSQLFPPALFWRVI